MRTESARSGANRIRVAAVLILIAAVSLLSPGKAEAYAATGCKFNVNGTYTSSGRITYKPSNLTSTWTNAQASAATRWNTTTAAPDLVITSAASANEWIYDDNYTAGWFALTTGNCSGRLAYWGSNQIMIQYNLRTTADSTWSTVRREETATHETGHGWGLNHTPNSCSVKSVMADTYWIHQNCASPGVAPWADDIAGKNFIY